MHSLLCVQFFPFEYFHEKIENVLASIQAGFPFGENMILMSFVSLHLFFCTMLSIYCLSGLPQVLAMK
jgi:hypothetical protein